VGDLAPVEAAFALKQLVEGQGGNVECRTDGARLPAGNRSGYVGNVAIEELDTAKEFVLIGTNPAIEAPVLNARIRKAWINGANVTLVGPAADLTYEHSHAGTGRDALAKVKAGEDAIVIVGQGALNEADGAAVLAAAQTISGRVLVLHGAAGRVGAMDAGCTTEGGMEAAIDGADVIYNLGADEIDIQDGPFVIYQGSHGDRGAHRADVILPAAAYPEEQGLFVNTEGRPQLALRASFPPGEAKENWAILRALSGEMGQALPYDSLIQLRKALVAEVPHLAKVDQVVENEWQPLPEGKLGNADFRPAIRDFYLTNPIARASELMAELSANAKARQQAPVAAE